MVINKLIGGQLKVLSSEDIKEIHSATLAVLNDVGVRMEYPPALKAMQEFGCKVDFKERIVKIPESILQKALSTAPSQFTLCGKTPEWDVEVNCKNVYTIGGSSALFVYDLDRKRRPATLQDLINLTKLQDALDNLDIMHGIVNPQDIPQPGFDRILFANVVPYTSRNYYSQALGAQGVRDQVEMASVILGSKERLKSRPIFTIVICLISPLTMPDIRLEELMECAQYDITIYVEVDSQPGGTTPVTLAGTLVEQNSTVLAGITLAQLLKPGLPCIYSIASGIMDMSTANYSGGAPDTSLLHAATAQMAHFYNLPCQGGTGLDATVSDAQAGYERALQVLTCALGGTDFVHLSIGMVEQMLTASYEQCVVDNEIIGAAFRIVKGIEVNKDTIALEAIKEVGPGGNYLIHQHTLDHFRKERWFPKLTNREKWEAWEANGAKDMSQRANEEARRILKEHDPLYIPEKVLAEIQKIAQDAQERLVKP